MALAFRPTNKAKSLPCTSIKLFYPRRQKKNRVAVACRTSEQSLKGKKDSFSALNGEHRALFAFPAELDEFSWPNNTSS